VRQAAFTGSVVDAVIAWHDPSSYGSYGWLIADTSYAELAAKSLGSLGLPTREVGLRLSRSTVTAVHRVATGAVARTRSMRRPHPRSNAPRR
jgi:hypothetical protein